MGAVSAHDIPEPHGFKAGCKERHLAHAQAAIQETVPQCVPERQLIGVMPALERSYASGFSAASRAARASGFLATEVSTTTTTAGPLLIHAMKARPLITGFVDQAASLSRLAKWRMKHERTQEGYLCAAAGV